MPEAEATNLAGRDELIGRHYPVYLEKLLLLAVVIMFVSGYEDVSNNSGEGIVSVLATWCLFPFILLFSAEMLGRLIQHLNRD